MLQKVSLFFLLYFYSSTCQAQLAKALPNGHAHNDYEKPWSPLTKALEQGFVSIEIDIFPYREELKVAHIGFFLDLAPELEELYFKPLELWLKEHQQFFEEPNQRLILMLDIKQNAAKSYDLLKLLCLKYQHLITTYYPFQDSIAYGKVDILLSGNKPYAEVLNDSVRFMLIDGGLNDINDTVKTSQIAPRVSANYHHHFKWRGKGAMPQKERQELRILVQKAHADHRKLRFWAMPNNSSVWKVFLDEGVDWINVDKLEDFQKFYWKHQIKR